MKTIGFIGLGNMGMGMARNLIAKGFAVQGYARSPHGAKVFTDMGGIAVAAPAEVARGASAVFLMVMSAEQVDALDQDGLLAALAPGCALIITATIGQKAVQQLARKLARQGVDIIDTPVSGGTSGANNGTLALMAAARPDVLERHADVLHAVGSHIIHVGEEPGIGQVVKSCLQTLIGVSFLGLFEAMVLGKKAGLDPTALANVINNSFVGSKLTTTTTAHIIERRFRGTGSHISTMLKDLGISLDMGRELGVTMPAAATTLQMFQAGKNSNPDGDNWCIVELLESLAGMAPSLKNAGELS